MIIRKILQDTKQIENSDDITRIQKICLKNGYELDVEACEKIWNEYSALNAAGWLGLPDEDEELWQIIESKIKDSESC